MELLRFVPVKLTFFLVFGILIGYYADLDLYPSLILVIACLLVLGLLLVREKRTGSLLFGIFTGLTTMCIGVLAISLSQPKNESHHYVTKDFQGRHTWHVKVREVLKSTPFSDRYTMTVIGLDAYKTSGKVLLNVYTDTLHKKFQIDDELVLHTSLHAIKQPLNPHQFNYADYLRDLGIYHQIYLNAQPYFMPKNPSVTIYGLAGSFRNTIISKLREANFGKEELPIIQALLLGQRNDISTATYNSYKNAGAVHILALSGLHIGIILVLLQFLLGPMDRMPHGKTLKLVVIVVLLWIFALMAGLSASIVRSVTMFSFVAYAMYLNRPANTFNILALSMFFILLLFDPALLFQVGFQMSYAAVFAIVWIYPLLQKFWSPKNWLLQRGWQLLSVSIAAQLGVLPISLFYFHQFPGLFFVSNLLVLPFLGIVLGAGILVIVLALFNMLPHFLASFYNFLIYGMNAVIGWVARQEVFIFDSVSFDAPKLVLSYVVIVSTVLICSKITYKRVMILLVGIMGFQIWNLYTLYQTRQKEEFLVAHQNRNTVLFHQKGNRLNILAVNGFLAKKLTTDYSIAEHIDTIVYRPIKNSYRLNGKKVFIMDGLGVYPPMDARPDYVVLTQSPKIHLVRFIDSVKPKAIIADGSNYKSDIDRWKATCTKRKLPFHYTGEKGAYYFNLE